MLITIAYGLAIVLSLAIVAIGVRFLIAPRVAAAGYGVPAKEDGDLAYLTVKGVRDTCVGLLGLTSSPSPATSPPACSCWSSRSPHSPMPSSSCETGAQRPPRSGYTSRLPCSSSSTPPCFSPSKDAARNPICRNESFKRREAKLLGRHEPQVA